LGAFLDSDDVVVGGLAMNHRGRARYFAADQQLLTRRATDLFAGAPYQWGGVTPWGADCSGFVQTIFALHGIQLPRDAWQQAEHGRPVAGELGELRRDDGKITHVAIALGGVNVVHCALANGGFAIDAIDAATSIAQHLRATFRLTKRVF
jgi:cell wall-associated NlpC family hydrolase